MPKAGGDSQQTRMIFHLSFDFKTFKSVNFYIPDEYCSVKYHDLVYAVRTSLHWLTSSANVHGVIFYSKTDVRSAFRVLPLKKKNWCWLIMKACDVSTDKWVYFVEKCVPFGSASSCALFQKFSDALKAIFEYRVSCILVVTNYLDDFLFVAYTIDLCNEYMRRFMQLCVELNLTLADDKTVWATLRIVFLGILMLGDVHMLAIPLDKKQRALNMVNEIIEKKITVEKLQQFIGLLNFSL